MNFKITTLYISFLMLIVGCTSTTPGDAAYRGGHFKPAADLYHSGAKQGDNLAAFKLGLMLSEKKVSSTNYGTATIWFIQACESGNDAACHNTGNAYEYGKDGVKKNYNKARKYYTMAAEKGFMQSQYNLGSMYSNQYFNDDVEGYKWMLIALKSAEACSDTQLCQWVKKDPPKHRTKLISRMSKSQINRSQKEAEIWKQK